MAIWVFSITGNRVANKFRGVEADININFNISDYDDDIKQVECENPV